MTSKQLSKVSGSTEKSLKKQWCPIRKLIECIPNISEGRQAKVIEELADVIRSVPLVKLLDISPDPDHNRTVYTFMGPPPAVRDAAYKLTERAIGLIDIESHEGAHPYIGAVDVIPFVPLVGVTREEIVELARSFGDKVAHDLKLPVYFYGYAALREERRELPDVRRGGYHKLKQEINTAARQPDYGAPVLHKRGGAVAIGVRDFLIAFNINLNSDDLVMAKEIAKSIRETHGGLPGVRAMAFPLKSKDIVQISMNLIDHRETTLREIKDFVMKKAEEKGIKIRESEIIGLIPRDAMFPNMKEYLKLRHFDGKNILNNYL